MARHGRQQQPGQAYRIHRIGYLAFFAGWAVVPFAWFANPAVVIGLALQRSGRPAGAGVVAFIGLALALATLGMAWNGWSPGLGFWLWAIAPGLLALGCIFESAALAPDRASDVSTT